MKIRVKDGGSCRLGFIMALLSLLFLLLISGTNAQSRPGTIIPDKEIKAASNQYQRVKSPEELSSNELASLLRRMDRLEKKVVKLEAQNDYMLREISNVNRLCKEVKIKGSGIQKVVRTGMRPNKNDTMISVAGMLSVWDQMDMIMDKLDEIIALLSE